MGGTGDEVGADLALDSGGQLYVTGYTGSSDFPTTAGAFDRTLDGPLDAFVTKLDPSGSTLVYSTYLGGRGDPDIDAGVDLGSGIVVDAAGRASVIGTTGSFDFPTTPGAFDRTCGSDGRCDPEAISEATVMSVPDVFVGRFNAAGSGLVYSTFVGGRDVDLGSDLELDVDGNAYLTGGTMSDDFPRTPGAFDRTCHCEPPPYRAEDEFVPDVFVTKLNAAGAALVYSTFLGGIDDDAGADVAADGAGNAYVIGRAGTGFPTTPGAFDRTFNGRSQYDADAFVAKLNPTGSNVMYSTYLGGQQHDVGTALAVDARGAAYITGWTFSSEFPTTPDAVDRTLGGIDGFAAKLDPAGSALLFSTLLGGSPATDVGFGLALGATGMVYIAGWSGSRDFPTTSGAFDTTHNGASDGFVAKLALGPAVLCGGRAATLVGTEGNDVLIGTPDPDIIDGLGGNDRIEGRGGNDVLCGELGFDLLFGDDGDDRLYGQAGNDGLDGGPGTDLLLGGNGEDLLEGGGEADALWGGDGNDRLYGRTGDDLLEGELGADLLSGGGGRDQLNGRGGNDDLQGGDGDDGLDGGDAVDRCDGGGHVVGDTAASCENVTGVP